MPTRFLLRNINRKSLATEVGELASLHSVDIVILIESLVSPVIMLDALNSFGRAGFQFPSSQCKRVTIFTRFARKFLQPKHEDERTSIRRLLLPSRPELLLAAVHLPSKMFWSADSQAFECDHLAKTISAIEDKIGHMRTVLVGDFNMNPFEAGVVAAGGLNAVMSKATAARFARTVQGREYRFFYNAMWAHFGDARGNVAGTYYSGTYYL